MRPAWSAAWLLNEGTGDRAQPGHAGPERRCFRFEHYIADVERRDEAGVQLGLTTIASSQQYADAGVIQALNGATQASLMIFGNLFGTTTSSLAVGRSLGASSSPANSYAFAITRYQSSFIGANSGRAVHRHTT